MLVHEYIWIFPPLLTLAPRSRMCSDPFRKLVGSKSITAIEKIAKILHTGKH